MAGLGVWGHTPLQHTRVHTLSRLSAECWCGERREISNPRFALHVGAIDTLTYAGVFTRILRESVFFQLLRPPSYGSVVVRERKSVGKFVALFERSVGRVACATRFERVGFGGGRG